MPIKPNMVPFAGMVPTSKARPAELKNDGVLWRDQFQLSTWLLMGAALQSVTALLVGRLAFLPAALVLLYRLADTYAMATGLKHNVWSDSVIRGKFSAQFPDALGNYGSTPGRNEVGVLLIGARSNSPLGLLAPGFREIGNYFQEMNEALEASPNRNASLVVMYFKNVSYVHKYAESPLHRHAVNHWNKELVKKYPHLSIYHELFQVPRGNWESIYENCPPLGLAATKHAVRGKGEGEGEGEAEVEWMSPVVDARRGILSTSKGRMSGRDSDE
ncbi:hypothetical protein H2203_005258 [Taxawa tesnikishii (nom. ined.)]|nr:hypothetical protein H2203_005258 [Dothideales sp. JES 119]